MSRVSSRVQALFLAAPLALIATSLLGAERARPTDENPNIQFSADQVQYDQTLGIVTATGNVEVQYEDRVLTADTVSYNQRQDLVTASGNVVMLEPTGEVLFAEYAEVTGDLKNGIAQDFRLVLQDKSRLAANGARMQGNSTEMAKAVYSPCEVCKDNPDKPPLWQLKAVRVVHDRETKTVEYKDAWLELGGIPVAYTPYMTHPDPTVRRRSGLLAPSFGNSSTLGFLVRTPYFWAIDDQSDLTLTPTIMSKQYPLLAGQYRQRLENGRWDTTASLTADSDDKVRGHINSMGRFDLDPTWRAGFDLQRTTDDTYLRRYHFEQEDDITLTSDVYGEAFRGRNYARIEGLAFQSMRSDVDTADTPFVLPWASYSHMSEPNAHGAYMTLDANLLSLTHAHDSSAPDRETRRASSILGWHLPYTGPMGDVYRLSATLQTDVYNVNNHFDQEENRGFQGTTGRAFPQIELDWRYPFLRPGESVSQVIEPIVSLIASPYGQNPGRIPNEDSVELEFDDTNLFSSNRFSGTDRIETGPRVNYGLQWSGYANGPGNASALIGQSYRLHRDAALPQGSGLEDNLSDYVARVTVTPQKYLSLGYRTRLDKDDLSPRRNEFAGSVGTSAFSTGINYSFFDQTQGSEFGAREQVSGSINARLTRYWRSDFTITDDLTQDTGGLRQIRLRLIYEDECFMFTTDLRRDYYQDREIRPETSIVFGLSFKTLGEIQASAF